jgi:hypothetical protein
MSSSNQKMKYFRDSTIMKYGLVFFSIQLTPPATKDATLMIQILHSGVFMVILKRADSNV